METRCWEKRGGISKARLKLTLSEGETKEKKKKRFKKEGGKKNDFEATREEGKGENER